MTLVEAAGWSSEPMSCFHNWQLLTLLRLDFLRYELDGLCEDRRVSTGQTRRLRPFSSIYPRL